MQGFVNGQVQRPRIDHLDLTGFDHFMEAIAKQLSRAFFKRRNHTGLA